MKVKDNTEQSAAAPSRKREASESTWSYFFDDHRGDFNEYATLNDFVSYVEDQYKVQFAFDC